MIDVTTMQTFPTPEILIKEITALQQKNIALTNTNSTLTNTNKVLRGSAIILLLIGLTIGGYKLYKKHKDNESK